MRDLAEKLIGTKQSSDFNGPSALFGMRQTISASLRANRPPLRIGLWPIISDEEPELAMGLASLLGLLLECWTDIRVYRLPARVTDERPDDYVWTINQSQFGVDDWELDGLDENVAIWGSWSKQGEEWVLKLEVENDLSDNDPHLLTRSVQNAAEAIMRLPSVAAEIAEYLEASDLALDMPFYTSSTSNNNTAERLLKQLFDWELNLFLQVWGREWSEEQLESDFEVLLSSGSDLGIYTGAWIVSNAVAHALSAVYLPIGEILVPLVDDVIGTFEDETLPAIVLAKALFQAGYALNAYDFLEGDTEYHPQSVKTWLTLAELYWRGGEFALAVDTFQRAVKAKAVSAQLYRRYADILAFLDASEMTITVGARHQTHTGRVFNETYILIDADDSPDEALLWEIVEAYRAALIMEPDHIETLSQLILQLIDLKDEDVWQYFERLVSLDTSGDSVRTVVETWHGVEDISPGLAILRNAVMDHPQRVDLHVNMAVAYMIDEQTEAARNELEKARQLSTLPQSNAEIERLMLSVDNPEFEARLGEITDLINAGHEINPEDVEMLENTVEKAPTFATGYLLLAGAYLAWDEPDDALDTLLDGQKHLPDQPDILFMLARILWDAGEEQLAFDYLSKGLIKHPNHVSLLALTGRYLFEDGQEEEARGFLARAEAIDPRHPVLNEVRIYIAKSLSE
jgi:tetratricopeptide (TPR) repeat protein